MPQQFNAASFRNSFSPGKCFLLCVFGFFSQTLIADQLPEAPSSDGLPDNGFFEKVSDKLMVTEADFTDTIPVVLTATRMSQAVNKAPASVTVINREMIEASGAQEIGDLLRLVPGFQVGYFNGISMSLAYHGFTGNYDRRLQVLIDGRSAYMPFLSTVEWLSLPLDISEVEKVEVIRSSNAPVYGANAIQGVINIITRKPFEDKGFMLEGRWGTYDVTGTDNDVRDLRWTNFKNRLEDRKYLLRYANSFKSHDYRITMGYQSDQGFEDVTDSKELRLVHVDTQSQINSRDSLSLQVGARFGDMDTFAGGTPEDPNRNKEVSSQYQSLTWSRALNNSDELKVHFYHNYYDQDDETRITDSSSFPFPYSFGVYHGTAERFDLEIERIIQPSNSVRMIVGAGARQDRIKSKHMLGSDDFINDYSTRLFTNIEWSVTDKILVNSGVMLERNEQIGSYFSPRLALNYLVNDEHTIRASVTRSIRTPSVLENNVNVGVRMDDGTEVYVFHKSETNLKPERQYSAELGYLYNSRSSDFHFDTKLFIEHLRDGILEADECGVSASPWVWGNNTRSNMLGLESQLYYKPHRRFYMNLSHSRVSANATWHICDNWKPGLKPADRDVSNSVPKDTFSGLFSYALTPSVNWSFVYYYITDMNWLQDGNIVKEHDRLDSHIEWNKRLNETSRLRLSLTLQNMLDDYVEVQNETVFKQRMFVSAKYEW